MKVTDFGGSPLGGIEPLCGCGCTCQCACGCEPCSTYSSTHSRTQSRASAQLANQKSPTVP